ncbi:hypothetical protein [Sulfuricurvum sp.]|uniref:hypothetical protein n=1 Tax=Sulfuricurvum sp. TaxID=2025608 RepID=UPI002E32ADF1|nr:hypothetical protein [Sulfuricurvum sp.]HEX5329079.1 hypothetical protein [Sulfuricurvum sp.]
MERSGLTPADGGAGILITRTLFVAFLVIGCSSQNSTLPYPLTISEEGLGAIYPDTPFDQINTALSGFEFEKLSQISSNQSNTILQMKRGNNLIAQIVSDPSGKKISEIYILSPLIKNKHAIGIGDPLPQDGSLKCEHDLCQSSDEPSLHYRIDLKERTIREITFSRL